MSAFQRIKQFYWSIFDKVSEGDILYIDNYLNEEEKKLFYKLSSSEQKHCVRVGRLIEERLNKDRICNLNRNNMIKLGLLHDIGKIVAGINPIEKSILVLLNIFTKGKLRKYSNFNKIRVFYYHGELGYTILKEMNYEERFLNVIKNHHNLNCTDCDVVLLRECDDKS